MGGGRRPRGRPFSGWVFGWDSVLSCILHIQRCRVGSSSGLTFFFVFVSVLLLCGGLARLRTSRPLWPGFASGAGSLAFVGGVGGVAPATDEPPARVLGGWVGSHSSMVGLTCI